MKIAAFAFRFRVLIFLLLYLLGFLAPWEQPLGGSHGTLWLAASSLLARSGWPGLASATMVLTLFALGSLMLGAVLRVWGTAHLGSTATRGAVLEGDRIVAAGPYRYVRNPLYLGSWLVALGSSVLMPVSGALFFLPALTAFNMLLIFTEEHYLAATAGAAYQQYYRQVPRLLPRFATPVGDAAARPRWVQAFLAEAYPVAFCVCFMVFAWRYNAHVLIRCLLVCYGLSLVIRASIKDH